MKNRAYPKKMTLRDIAAMAGLSHTTISRVLNGDTHVSQQTREKVLELVNKVGFKPNPVAKALSSSRSRLIGLVLSDIANPFYNDIIRGVEDEATRRGYRIVLHSTSSLMPEHEDFLGFLLGSGVDGFVVLSAHLYDPLVEALVHNSIPTVLVHRTMARDICSNVSCNQALSTEAMLRHLYSLGRRRIALISGSRYNSTSVERMKAYQQTLKDLGLPYREDYTYQGRCFRENGVEAAECFFALPEPPDAVFASNDIVALGVMDVAFRAGLEIPRDISIVGGDDADFSSNQLLSLSSVNIRKYEMGTVGAQICIDTLERERLGYIHKVNLDPFLVIRRSCGVESLPKT